MTIDAEHATTDLETVQDMLQAMKGTDATPLVRPPMNDPIWIRQVLDAGAAGIIVPMVNSAEEAAQAVQYAKYPPMGIRGIGFCRANQYGVNFFDYIPQANDVTIVLAQIEHIKAVESIEAILDTEGIDGIFVGPYDLTGSMGLLGQLDHPKVLEALQHVLDVCKQKNKPAGTHVVPLDTQQLRQRIEEGFKTIAWSLDVLMLSSGCRTGIEAAKAAL